MTHDEYKVAQNAKAYAEQWLTRRLRQIAEARRQEGRVVLGSSWSTDPIDDGKVWYSLESFNGEYWTEHKRDTIPLDKAFSPGVDFSVYVLQCREDTDLLVGMAKLAKEREAEVKGRAQLAQLKEMYE